MQINYLPFVGCIVDWERAARSRSLATITLDREILSEVSQGMFPSAPGLLPGKGHRARRFMAAGHIFSLVNYI